LCEYLVYILLNKEPGKMAKRMVIIGCSNTRNTFGQQLKKLDRAGGVKAEYVSATSFTVGCEALKTVTNAAILLVCFLLNGITDATELCTNDEEIAVKVGEVIDAYCAAIILSATNNPTTKVYVMPPFFRSTPDWLTTRIDGIADIIMEGLRDNQDIVLLPLIKFTSEDLTDSVHLNPDAQTKLYSHVTSVLFPEAMDTNTASRKKRPITPTSDTKVASGAKRQTRLAAPAVTAANETPASTEPMTMTTLYNLLSTQIANVATTSKEFGGRVVELEEKVETLEDRIDYGNGSIDALVWQSANQADITDSLVNDKNLNQVIVSGLKVGAGKNEDGMPKTLMEVAQHLAGTTKVHPGAIKSVYPQKFPVPKPGYKNNFVIHFNCVEAGILFRQQANQFRKDTHKDWTNVYVQNVVTKSTQVRIFLLQSIAKELQNLPANTGKFVYCSKYESRPQLCFKKERIEKRMFYVDAIQKYAGLISETSHAQATKIAGRSYGPRLKPTFAIL
jgi:hypothetical protein